MTKSNYFQCLHVGSVCSNTHTKKIRKKYYNAKRDYFIASSCLWKSSVMWVEINSSCLLLCSHPIIHLDGSNFYHFFCVLLLLLLGEIYLHFILLLKNINIQQKWKETEKKFWFSIQTEGPMLNLFNPPCYFWL